ncbi:MAG TPA: alpha/beta fold hydrolase [Propionibacteriaceae bacterium]|jgi:pimeloyl-ACP methyl ester carboxylesterase|nr:alpha/beta fold hydrolase [Propionibacteriaceae bacterium]
MRACQPISDGYVERDGVKVYYEVFGAGEPTVLLLPTWTLMHSRQWKMQVPYLARHCRVLTFDPRGNGRSDRPTEFEAYAESEFAADAIAVMDATQTDRAIIVGFSQGVQRGLLLAANHPERVEAAVFIGPTYPGGGHPRPERAVYSWEDELDSDEGWARYNKHYWLRDYRGFLKFFLSTMFPEPHSTKPIEDGVGWGLETTGETLVLTDGGLEAGEARELARRVRCPVLVVHGDRDGMSDVSRGIALAEHTGGQLVVLEGSGHAPHVRDPVKVNLLVRDFLKPAPPPRRWVRGRSRRKRALYISSPIGLGHAQRDVGIADELRKLHPDLEIDWLAQHPVTKVLQAAGERIHPASALLSNESSHIESESAEHDLHCFQAIRRMDEILLSNFMVFHDLVREEPYDLWIGDEAWELDYYLHENPEQKRAAYVWLTDFVGWLPMPDGGEHEAFLTADYNAEMIEHIARFPRVRDHAIFVGNDSDIVPDAFGPELPLIRDWTREHYSFAGYVTGFDPSDFADRARLRHELGYRDDEQICIVTVGGSGVGGHLLRRVIEAFPEAKHRVPALRMVVVTGPRIDPDTFPKHEGLEVRGFVPELYRHLAACDLAVVQGGLTTCMELTATRRPFLYVPLRHHFEQNFHVRHRLEQYGAGRLLDFDVATPERIGEMIAQEIGRQVDYRPVEHDGATAAAALIAELL